MKAKLKLLKAKTHNEFLVPVKSSPEYDEIEIVSRVLVAISKNNNLKGALRSIAPNTSGLEAEAWANLVLRRLDATLPNHILDQLHDSYEYSKPWTEESTPTLRDRWVFRPLKNVTTAALALFIATIYYLGCVTAYRHLIHFITAWHR